MKLQFVRSFIIILASLCPVQSLKKDQQGLHPITIAANNQKNNIQHENAKNPDATPDTNKLFQQHAQFLEAYASHFSTSAKMARLVQGIASDPNHGLSGTCVLHLLDAVEGFYDGRLWAWLLFDSWGKVGPGVLTLYPVLRGQFEECQKVKAIKKSTRSEHLQAAAASSASPSTSDHHGFSHPQQKLKDQNVREMAIQGHNTSVEVHHQLQEMHSGDITLDLDHLDFKSYLDFLYNDKSSDLSHFKGKMCRVGVGSHAVPIDMIEVPFLHIYVGVSVDICVPDSCSAKDADIFMNRTVENLIFHSNVGQFVTQQSTCEEDLPWESKTIGVIVFLVVSLSWLAFCTFYDIFYIQKPKWKLQKLKEDFIAKRATLLKTSEASDSNGHIINGSAVLNGEDRARLLQRERDRGKEDHTEANGHGESLEEILFKEPTISSLAKTLQFFSVFTNGSKIMNTEVAPGTLKCIHGIRFLSMSWIILGHTLLVGMVSVGNVAEFMFEERKYVLFLIIGNGFLSVDTFFVVSGVMVGYFFKDIAEHVSKLKYPVYILHRFFRLTPAVIVFAAVYIGLWPHLGSGPNKPAKAPDEDACVENWMWTLFYINNFLPLKKMCLVWTWYLSCDYQFYLFCPIFMVPLCLGWRKTGVFIATSLAIGSMVLGGLISYNNRMTETLPQLFRADGTLSDPRIYYNEFYQRPYTRMGPYIVGLLIGFVLKVTNRKVEISTPVAIFGWLVSTVVALTVLFGIHDSFAQYHLMSVTEAAVYNAFKHTAFGLCIGWVVFACLTGHGGIADIILSWRGFVPFSRLTYCTYLVHPAVIYLFSFSFDGLIILNMWSLILHWIGFFVVSLALGFLLSLTVESPTIQLEKDFLRRIGYYDDQPEENS